MPLFHSHPLIATPEYLLERGEKLNEPFLRGIETFHEPHLDFVSLKMTKPFSKRPATGKELQLFELPTLTCPTRSPSAQFKVTFQEPLYFPLTHIPPPVRVLAGHRLAAATSIEFEEAKPAGGAAIAMKAMKTGKKKAKHVLLI